MLEVTAADARAELARYQLTTKQLAIQIGMVPSQLSNYLSGSAIMRDWTRHNIGLGINVLTGLMVFDVDMSKPLQNPRMGRPPKILSVNIPIEPERITKHQRAAYLRRNARRK